MLYAFTENFVLPLSHDEVVHGKGSLLGKMPGDEWQKFANLRLLYGYMYAQPGEEAAVHGRRDRPGARVGTRRVGRLGPPAVPGARRPAALGRRPEPPVRDEPALHELDCSPDGFAWVDCNDADQSIVSLVRRGRSTDDRLLVVCNFTPVLRRGYLVGAPRAGFWQEVLNTDADLYGGSNQGNAGGVEARAVPWHGQPASLQITLPPLAAVYFKSSKPVES